MCVFALAHTICHRRKISRPVITFCNIHISTIPAMLQAESYCYPIGMTVYKPALSVEDGSLGRWWLRREADIWDFPIFLAEAGLGGPGKFQIWKHGG